MYAKLPEYSLDIFYFQKLHNKPVMQVDDKAGDHQKQGKRKVKSPKCFWS